MEDINLIVKGNKGSWSLQGEAPEKRELHRERTPEMCREFLTSIWWSTDQHKDLRKLPEAGKTAPWHRACNAWQRETNACFTSQNGKQHS